MTTDLFGLEGKAVLVTGGSSGIGLACAEAFAQAGAEVVLTSRTKTKAATVAKGLQKKYGVRCVGLGCEVGNERSVAALARDATKSLDGPILAVVNNAGHEVIAEWWSTPLHEMTPAQVEQASKAVARVDLEGSRWVTYHFLPTMIKQGDGRFVYVSSTPAIAGYQGFPYTEAKAAILGLMRDVARVYGPKGIRANAVAPGNIRTAWLDRVPPKERRRLETENPLRRFGEPAEVAKTILFLASDLSSFVTGETIIVDGGTVIR